MNTIAASRSSICALATALFLGTPLSASAGFLRINFDDLLETHGFNWDGSGNNDIDLSADGSVYSSTFAAFDLSDDGDIPFATTPFGDGLRIGDTTYDSFCLSSDGTVGLGSSASACTLTPSSTSPLFSVLGGSWDYTPASDAFGPQSIAAAFGLVDRDLDGDGTFELADALPALRLFWWGMEEGALEFQAIFYDLGGGDFDVEFNYGDAYSEGIQRITAPGAAEDLFFGVDDARLTGLATDPYFTFRSGVFALSTDTTTPPTPVPEPGALLLFSTGAILLLLRRRSAARLAAR
jgi:hypothetical protein